MRGLQFIKYAFLIAVSLLLFAACSAQDLPHQVKRNGDKFYVHEVKEGQTLFAISKKYFCDVEDIKEANPDIEADGLKIGQTILIPRDAMDRRKFRRIEVTIGDDELIHEVHRKETLYSLSKKYNLSIEEIKNKNPQIEEKGLQPGMKLIIPYAQSEDAEPDVMRQPRHDSLQLHRVKKKETLFSISKLYGVSVDSIQIVNNGLPDGLQEGATIRIPKKREPVIELSFMDSIFHDTTVKDTLLTDTSGVADWKQERTFEIAVMLPFKSYLADTTEQVLEEAGEFKMNGSTRAALNIYRGIKMAADTMEKRGFDANIRIYDTGNDPDTLKSLFRDSIPEFDLVIGPLFRTNFQMFADSIKHRRTPIVSPVPLPTKVLAGRPNAVKVFPGRGSQVIKTAYFVVDHHLDSNLILWNSNRFGDRDVYDIAHKHANLCAAQLGADSLKEVSLYTPTKNKVRALFDDSSSYTLFVPTINQAYVSELLHSLQDVLDRKKGVSISVYGLKEWSQFDNLETEVFQDLDVRLPAELFADYESEEMKRFLKLFRKQFGTDPTDYTLAAYDASLYFFNLLDHYGPYLLNRLHQNIKEGLITKFNFMKLDTDTGFENQGIFIYRFEEFEKVRVH